MKLVYNAAFAQVPDRKVRMQEVHRTLFYSFVSDKWLSKVSWEPRCGKVSYYDGDTLMAAWVMAKSGDRFFVWN